MSARLPLADIRFLADFHAFALSKGDREYSYGSCDNCACAQFLRHSGRASRPNVAGEDWNDHAAKEPLRRNPFPPGLGDALVGPRTFSALATRLETLLADAPAVELVQ